jgi:hypothetical protein
MMTVLYVPILFIDIPDITLPELNSLIVGEKVAEGFSPFRELVDSTPPLTAWFYALCDSVFGHSLVARHVLSFIILFLQGAFLSIILIDKKVFTENTYIPAFIFSILAFFSFDTLSLTGDLAAFGFILLSLNNLFKEIEFRVQRDETIFNMGIFISLASLFSFSYIIYLPGALAILTVFTRTSPRKYLLLLFGFLLPHLFLITVYFYTDALNALWQFYYLPNLRFPSSSLMDVKSLFLLCAVPLLYLFISLFILGRDAHLTKYQSQIFQAVFLWFVIAIVQIIFSRDLRPQSLLPLLPPVSFFFTHFLLLIRRKKFAEMNAWVLLLGIVIVAYLARYGKLDSIRYENLKVQVSASELKGKRILVLNNQPDLFLNNTLGSPFYEWKLYQPIFEHPDYYDHVLMVHHAFEKEKPDVIVDPNNLMAGFLDRLPTLKLSYEKSPEGYRLKKISN